MPLPLKYTEMVVWGYFIPPKPEQTCLICPPELPRGEKMHIGGVSKLVSPWAGISPIKTERTAQMWSFILLFTHRLHFISHCRQQQKVKKLLAGFGASWGRGAAQPSHPRTPWLAGWGAKGQGKVLGGHRQQGFPCAPVREGFGYIKTSWAKSSLRGGLVLAAVPSLWAPAEPFSVERDAGSVINFFFFFRNNWVT